MLALAEEIRHAAQPKDWRSIAGLGDILACSATMNHVVGGRSAKVGIDGLRWAALCAAGLECDEQGRRRVLDLHIEHDEIDDGKPP